jgi:hypothetical protein
MLDVMGGQRSASGDLVHMIPPERFGQGKARILRKMVLLAIAASANPDGTNAWPSRETIAQRCLVTVRGAAKVIDWLVRNKLLKVESKAAPTSKYGRTNRYTILFPKTRKMERKASRHREIEVHSEQKTPGTTEASTRNNSQEHEEQMNMAPGNGSSHNRPSLPPSVDRPSTPTTTEAAAVADAIPRKACEKTNQNQGMTSESLMVEVQRIFDDHGAFRLKTTKAHRKRAFEMAQEHGRNVFLGALHCWLHEEDQETFEVPTGEGYVEPKTWLLYEFMETGALHYIEKVKPYAHMDCGEVLRFLLHVQDWTGQPVDITSEQIGILKGLMKDSSNKQFTIGFNTAKGIDDFLDHAPEYVQKGKDEDFLNSVANDLGYKHPHQVPEEARTAFLKLMREIGSSTVHEALLEGAPWHGKSFLKVFRFCKEYAAAEKRRC